MPGLAELNSHDNIQGKKNVLTADLLNKLGVY